ncbi:MAG: hypothetical protein ACLPMG_10045 [Terriglobales bacterium]
MKQRELSNILKFIFQKSWLWSHCGLAKVDCLNDDVQTLLHKKLEIAMTENNPNQSGQQTQQPNQKPGQGGQQGGQSKPGQQNQQPNQKPGQGGQQGGQQK